MMGNLDGYSLSTMVIASILLCTYAFEFEELQDNLTAEVVCTTSMLSAIFSKLYNETIASPSTEYDTALGSENNEPFTISSGEIS